ncbi:MAG: CDP-diacylglycerol--serine O-phosphatidyltransferase [Candidatus Hydrogenedentes bacterium]|nr:CDP-diacylglycerol--serine O-phosphatidyltransferase [Candidatus Hydrogenedentota bacterium]
MKIKHFSKRRLKYAARRKPINVLASVFTTMNLYCGIASVFASIGLEFEHAALYILAGIVFDALDGFVARVTNSTSEFGKELDSLCDIVTFGLAPGVLVFTSYLPSAEHLVLDLSARTQSIVGKTGSYMAIIYIICTALRLARYNTYQTEQKDNFTGLPSPAAGGSLAAFVLFLQYVEPRLENLTLGPWAYYLLGPMAISLAFLMVSTVRYPKNRFKSFILVPRRAFFALGTYAFIIAIVHYALTSSPYLVLFPLGAAYVMFGIVETLYLRFFRRHELHQDHPTGLLTTEVPHDPADVIHSKN